MTAADAAQRKAADPAASAWVDASAGSGKTKVLVDRVLRLLVGGTAPQRILCLTFTTAAAAEMANRLHDRLARWAVAEEAALQGELETLLGAAPEPPTRDSARRLLARVLDAPGGMPIMTLHAFCQSLLRRFPLEAKAPPWFEVLDEREARETMDAVQRASIAAPDEALRDALGAVVRYVHETRVTGLLGELAGERARLRRAICEAGGLDALIERTHEAIGVARGTAPEDAVRAACAPGAGDEDRLRALAAAMTEPGRGGGDTQRGAAIGSWIAADIDTRIARFDDYRRAFLTTEDEPRKKVASVAVLRRQPEFERVVEAEQTRIARAVEDRKRATVATATAALLTVGGAVIDAYEARKRVRARLDFDDLILGAAALLKRSGGAAWVLYKLDDGLDHVLIDEAQDTNPEQWEVVRALTDEFFAGEGARRGPRTVFAVGDPKQSIYGFQRADPAKFSEMKGWFAGRARGAGQGWNDTPLETSFRSTAPVLAAVDAVFADEDAGRGVVFDGRPVRHDPQRTGQAGRVELWEPVEAGAPDEPAPWKPPVERIAAADAVDELAKRVAEHIAALCDGEHILESRRRPARPGDILVLVRSRGRFVHELTRQLKKAGTAVAGVDRMVLAEHIAVMDLMALGRFLLLPDDDLSLAETLKSPLFGFDDEALFALAHGREGQSLWARLVDAADSDPLRADARKRLGELLSRADRTTPWELYADLLAAGGGRQRFRSRLGAEADDPLDEFLAQALAYERANPPSLQGFLHWLATGGVEVKRNAAPEDDAVRITTVHGAKGMEAPVVYLPDTTTVPRGDAQLVWSPDGRKLLWPVRSEYRDPLSIEWIDAARARAREEYRRLLYVAMTRAEDRLIVCGWEGKGRSRERPWRKMVENAFDGLAGATAEPDGVRALCCGQAAAPDRAGDVSDAADAAGERAPPPWIHVVPPAESAAAPRRPTRPGPVLAPEAKERGRRLHRIMQAWPVVPDTAPDADRAVAEAAVAHVRRDPVFAPLFAPGSIAEAPIAAPAPQRLSGRVDRLAVTPDAVLAVDFKTGGAPADPASPPHDYVRQMAAYRDVLRLVFPGRPVRCALLWLDGPALTPLDDALLDGAGA